jgi:hypothetical protein
MGDRRAVKSLPDSITNFQFEVNPMSRMHEIVFFILYIERVSLDQSSSCAKQRLN